VCRCRCRCRYTYTVTQDDCLSNHLTVQETLQFYADLRLPSTISSDEKERKVLRLMNKLGLDKVPCMLQGARKELER